VTNVSLKQSRGGAYSIRRPYSLYLVTPSNVKPNSIVGGDLSAGADVADACRHVRVSLLSNAVCWKGWPYDGDAVYTSVSSDGRSCSGILTAGTTHSTRLLLCGLHASGFCRDTDTLSQLTHGLVTPPTYCVRDTARLSPSLGPKLPRYFMSAIVTWAVLYCKMDFTLKTLTFVSISWKPLTLTGGLDPALDPRAAPPLFTGHSRFRGFYSRP